ncbi:MAG: S8 family serine peptidase, partial [Bacteroidota bacterium]
MEDIDWSKLDRGMRAIFRNYLDRQENPAEKPPATLPDVRSADHELTVLIEHDGSLDAALASSINFEFQSQQGLGVAQGSLRIGDLPQICAVDAVKLVRFGQSRKRRLSQSVTQLNVEATTAALTDGIWFYDRVTDTFSGNTGKDVIIGIIDDGIDPTHPCFLTTDGRASRIVSIWDQGLTPQDEESSPNAALLQLNGNGSTEPYGVEYNSDVLNDVARRIIEPRTSGDNSHGTHVAGIAAGNGAQSSLNTELEENNTRTGNIGIAPEARLIIVRHIDVTSSIGDVIRERDALNYIVNKAASLGGSPAVVINGSYGGELHPHDGRDFQGSATSENTMHDVFHGQRGRIGVFAAGNGAADNAHLKVTFPAANRGQVRIPFTINDSRTN